MPMNKKKRSKKTFGKPNRFCSGTTAEPPSKVTFGQEEDRPSGYSARVQQLANNPDKITSSRLLKAIPDARQHDLRDTVALLVDARNENHFDKEEIGDFYVRMACLAVPGGPTPNNATLLLRAQILFEYSTLSSRTNAPSMDYEEEWMELVSRIKADMNIVMQNNRQAITMACFGNSEAAFLKHCNVMNKMSLSAFREALGEAFITEKLHRLQIRRRVRAARIKLSLGLDKETKYICWNCNATRCDFNCSFCHIAKYCSEVCQLNHWKQGHKLVCTQFERTAKAFENAHDVVCAAMSDVNEHFSKYGAKPSRVDHQIAFVSLTDAFVLEFCGKSKALLEKVQALDAGRSFQHLGEDIKKESEGISMVNFYNNVKHVMRGDFRTDASFKTWLADLEDKDCPEFFSICSAMMYNYEDEDGTLQVDLFRNRLARRPSQLPEDRGGFCQCTLSSWLTAYKRFELEESYDAVSIRYYRRSLQNKVTKWAREEAISDDLVQATIEMKPFGRETRFA